jgi:hypothetical protein
VAQIRIVGQRLDRCYAPDQSREVHRSDHRETPEAGKVCSTEDVDIREAPDARNLLGEEALQPRVDAVHLDRDGDKSARGFFNRLRGELRQRDTDDVHDLLLMMIEPQRR